MVLSHRAIAAEDWVTGAAAVPLRVAGAACVPGQHVTLMIDGLTALRLATLIEGQGAAKADRKALADARVRGAGLLVERDTLQAVMAIMAAERDRLGVVIRLLAVLVAVGCLCGVALGWWLS